MVAVSPSWAAFRTGLLLCAAAAMLVVGVRGLWNGAGESIVLVLGAAYLCFLAFALNFVGMRLHGDAFELTNIWRTTRGRAEEFVGWHETLAGNVRLLRRRDLEWIHIPTIVHGSAPDSEVRRWLFTFLPSVRPEGVRKVRRAQMPSKAVVVRRLQQPITDNENGFFASARDVELACTARMVAARRYAEAREGLEARLGELPRSSVAAPYVFEALLVVGNEATAERLKTLKGRFDADANGHWTRAFCALSTWAEVDELRALSKHASAFSRREAERALHRLSRPAEH